MINAVKVPQTADFFVYIFLFQHFWNLLQGNSQPYNSPSIKTDSSDSCCPTRISSYLKTTVWLKLFHSSSFFLTTLQIGIRVEKELNFPVTTPSKMTFLLKKKRNRCLFLYFFNTNACDVLNSQVKQKRSTAER